MNHDVGYLVPYTLTPIPDGNRPLPGGLGVGGAGRGRGRRLHASRLREPGRGCGGRKARTRLHRGALLPRADRRLHPLAARRDLGRPRCGRTGACAGRRSRARRSLSLRGTDRPDPRALALRVPRTLRTSRALPRPSPLHVAARRVRRGGRGRARRAAGAACGLARAGPPRGAAPARHPRRDDRAADAGHRSAREPGRAAHPGPRRSREPRSTATSPRFPASSMPPPTCRIRSSSDTTDSDGREVLGYTGSRNVRRTETAISASRTSFADPRSSSATGSARTSTSSAVVSRCSTPAAGGASSSSSCATTASSRSGSTSTREWSRTVEPRGSTSSAPTSSSISRRSEDAVARRDLLGAGHRAPAHGEAHALLRARAAQARARPASSSSRPSTRTRSRR